jgi:adenylosuccinate lyase
MEEPTIFDNISPLDHRYYTANKALFDRLRETLSETANVRYCLRAELALLRTHIHFYFDDDDSLISALDDAESQVTAGDVYAEEEKTQHNIRALVNVLQRHLPVSLRPFVHLGATSVDILDTAFSLRIRDAVRKVVLPLLLELQSELIETTLGEADTPQVGRTHGQHAVPISFGFAIAEYVARLGKSIEEIERRSVDVRGKLSGAVGAYNATSMIASDPADLEAYYLNILGLLPSEIATQMVEPEYILRLMTEIQIAFGIIANLADDLRNLQRSEIDEVREFFSDTQVGSSTMPQKRNPWNCEHVKSLWKAFAPRVMTFYSDQISEHQRDLTNSASSRFVGEYLAGFSAAAERMRRIMASLYVNREKMLAAISSSGGGVLAEPAYLLLALSGVETAHETVKQATLEMQNTGVPFIEVLKKHTSIWEAICNELAKRTGLNGDDYFAAPENYRGIASAKAREIALRYATSISSIKERLN